MPMAITITSPKPFEKVALDIASPFPTENGNKFILTVTDDLTKLSQILIKNPQQLRNILLKTSYVQTLLLRLIT